MSLSVRLSKFLIGSILFFAFSASLLAQNPTGGGGRPGGGGGGSNAAQMNIGHFYGKIVDAATGKPVEYASVQLRGMRWDSVSRSLKEAILGGQLTGSNGDFSIENLPIVGDFTIKLTCIGYETLEQTVTFGITRESMRNPGANRAEMLSKGEKDLGNLKMKVSSTVLNAVEITGEATSYSLALDKKVFKVDKNNIAGGGTAEEALKAIPSLSVDIDGNVTLRNAAPQIFVDGRPTNLTLNQIPADAIDNVELITNPSAKYDASGGGGGIVNIVLKKERRIGYSGNLRTGIDQRGRGNLGGDINAREGKINGFLSGNFNIRRSKTSSETNRLNSFPNIAQTEVLQTGKNVNDRYFANVRTGIDWFIDNRNTLTLAGNFTAGHFTPTDIIDITTDTLISDGAAHTFRSERTSNTDRMFQNFGGQMLFKHLFPKEGRELTADINYNGARNSGNGAFITDYFGRLPQGEQQQENTGGNNFVTFQTDYVTPLANGMKFEAGARAAIRDYTSENLNFQRDPATNLFVRVPSTFDRYEYLDQVYAAYGTFSQSFKRWGYQVGLRVESSKYDGTLPENGQKFNNQYPLVAFPSIFTTYKLNEEDNLQLNFTRRINRPNFFQLIPFPDFSDSLLLSRGNPNLVPEFTNSFEFSYLNILNSKHNFLVSAYYKYATNLITRYQFSEYNEFLGRDAVVSSFANANNSQAYGVELTVKNTFVKIVELTSNFNFYNSILNAENVEAGLRNEQFTWFAKENLNIRLPKEFVFQVTGEYQSRTAFAPSSGGGGGGRGGGGGGGGWMEGPTNTAQGYRLPVWFVDISLRRNFWKRKGSLTLSMEDIFASRRNGSYTANTIFTQETSRLRDPQFVRLQFSYRFGKFDQSLFRRKNTRVESGDMGF